MYSIYWLHKQNKTNTQEHNAKDNNVVMPMHILIEYSDKYSKISETLWQYYRDEPVFNSDDIVDFPDDNINSASFKFKQKITG